MYIYRDELHHGRTVFIVVRKGRNKSFFTGKIEDIIFCEGRHFLRVKRKLTQSTSEIIRVEISGKILPNVLLNSSIFFDEASAKAAILYSDYNNDTRKNWRTNYGRQNCRNDK